MDEQNKYPPKFCPRCGKAFPCMPRGNCWCMDIEIPEMLMSYLEMHYDDCLCEDCINELKEKGSYKHFLL